MKATAFHSGMHLKEEYLLLPEPVCPVSCLVTNVRRLLACNRTQTYLCSPVPSVAPLFGILQRIGLPVDFTYPSHVHDMGEAYWSSVLSLLPSGPQHYELICWRPSIVETTLRKNPLRTVTAHVMKTPWCILGKRYPFVGGWEVIIRRPVKQGLV
jgi:hypothetical protein